MKCAWLLVLCAGCIVRLDLSDSRASSTENMDTVAEAPTGDDVTLVDSATKIPAEGAGHTSGPWLAGPLGVFVVHTDGSVANIKTLGEVDEPTSDARAILSLGSDQALVGTARGMSLCNTRTTLACEPVTGPEDVRPDSFDTGAATVALAATSNDCIAFFTRDGVGCMSPVTHAVTMFAELQSLEARVVGAEPGVWLDRPPWLCNLDRALPSTERPHCIASTALSPQASVTAGLRTDEADVVADATLTLQWSTPSGSASAKLPGVARALVRSGPFLFVASDAGLLRAAWPLSAGASFDVVSTTSAVAFVDGANALLVVFADGSTKQIKH